MDATSLIAEWSGPHGGVPPLDAIELSAIEPAIREAMAREAAEVEAVRNEAAAPSFANTIEALERTGAALRRVLAVYHLLGSSYSTPALRELQHRVAPQLAAHRSRLRADPVLYARTEAVSKLPLSAPQLRLVDKYLRSFRRAGAHLDEAERARVAAIEERLSVLYTTFSDNVLADEEGTVHFLDASQLGGLSEGFRSAARAAAAERGRPEAWAVLNTRSSVEPFLTTSTERDLREVVWRAYYTRADHGDEHDNNEVIAEILTLRTERAKLLGYPHHAAMVLDGRMCPDARAAFDQMRQVWDAAVAKFRDELSAMEALAAERGDHHRIEPWDVRFYADQVRRAQHAFDPSELLPHFQLDQLVQGMFWAATERFGWTFTEVTVPVPHDDVTVWSVHDAQGQERGLFYLDPFARTGKRSGAWMSALRSQSSVDGPVLPLVTNNCNFTRSADGPTLLTRDEARTLFHEFGHALHGLSSAVAWRGLAGTSVPRDFVEFPSQLNEHWLTTPELLPRLALHAQPGQPPTAELLAKMTAAEHADAGFRTLEYLASGIVDMEMHVHTEPIDPAAFEREVLDRWGLPPQVVMRHRPPHFSHLFSGEGYSAGYYSYLWADALVADAAEHFAERGFYDRDLAKALMDGILSRGDSRDPAEMFRGFRGRDPQVEPLLRDRGLVPA